ncbi:MAG: mercury resistance system transport protein MerF [Hyphomicrobiaceae bacterium]
MNDSALIRTGIVGAVIAAICCATPILVIALGAVGLSAVTGYLDYVLLPALALSIGLIAFGVYKRRQGAAGIVNKTTTGT